MKLGRQITLGYALMFFLMLFVSGFSILSIYKLDKAATNIEGRYTTLSNLFSNKQARTKEFFSNEMLTEAIKIADEQVKYAYITVFTVVGIVLLFGGVMTLTFPKLIIKPILLLVEATKKVALGDFTHRVENINTSGEISTLTQAFNAMLESIEYNEMELKKKNEENLSLLEKTRRFNEILEAEVQQATREIREKQDELIKSERLATIGELATGVAHEIRNPLSGISIALELMKNETDNEEHKQTISDILKEINRLERIIKELLWLGQPRSLNLIECDPNEIVERAINLISLGIREKQITIEKRFSYSGVFQVDPEQIEQVIINLLLNATEAIDNSSGKITVETGDSGEDVQIRISDTGRGISKENREKIFQPFFSTKQNGTGLGLSVSSRIAEMHKGKILISSGEGGGSAFTVLIPANQQDR